MRKKILLEWTTALCSGKYERAKAALRDKNGYCPMGILCDLSQLDTWKEVDNNFYYLGKSKYLPEKVCEWAGITNNEKRNLIDFIIAYHDVLKYPFHKIAELILDKYKLKEDK